MITPVDIHTMEFKRSFRGYNENEVDDFLDLVVNDYESLINENEKLKRELEIKSKEVEHFHQMEKNLQETLLVAQRTSDELVAAANVRVEGIKAEADSYTKASHEKAKAEAEAIKAEAQAKARGYIEDAQKYVQDANDEVRRIRNEYDRIAGEKQMFITKMHALLQTEIALLEEVKSVVPEQLEASAGE